MTCVPSLMITFPLCLKSAHSILTLHQRGHGKTKAGDRVTGENKLDCLSFCDVLPFRDQRGGCVSCAYWERLFWTTLTCGNLLLLCFRGGGRGRRCVGGAYIIWLQRLRPLQRASSTKIQQHKQLIKVRWGLQKSRPPCWDVQCLPGHCYPTTKGAGWEAQTKGQEQTEIRDGWEEDSLCSSPPSPAGRRFSLDQQIVRPRLSPIKENECFKGSELVRKVCFA